MKGFKDSSKTVWIAGGYAKGGSVNGAAKVSKVMREFKSGELHSGSKTGPKVTSRKQATAIAMSEAGKTPVKKSLGGVLEAGASYLTGGIPGLISTLQSQKRHRELVGAAGRTAEAPATAGSLSAAAKLKPQDDTTQPMRKGGAVRKAEGGPVRISADTQRAMRETLQTNLNRRSDHLSDDATNAANRSGKLAAKRSMHREQEARTDAIVARGNRVAAEEQPSEALVMRRRGPNTPLIQSSAPPRSLLERKACGGLAAMPRKQGR